MGPPASLVVGPAVAAASMGRVHVGIAGHFDSGMQTFSFAFSSLVRGSGGAALVGNWVAVALVRSGRSRLGHVRGGRRAVVLRATAT